MKKAIIPIVSFLFLFSSCQTTRQNIASDDVYADPIEEKKLALAKAEAQKKKEAEEKAAKEAEFLAQKAKDDANPYYQDPNYSEDDYYDYAYASRMRRFHNPIYGTGYYDNYYTNAYHYNYDPFCYGTSIYSTYNWWMPSNQFGLYAGGGWGSPYCFNNGFNTGIGYNYWNSPYGYGYQPWGYNYWNNPWSYGWNSPWGSPYNNPYNPYFGSNWGYFNSYDQNSNYTYVPRQGNSGSNSARGSYAGMAVPKELNGEREKFFNSVFEEQEKNTRFTNYQKRMSNSQIGTSSDPNFSNPSENTKIKGNPAQLNSNEGGVPSNTKRGQIWKGDNVNTSEPVNVSPNTRQPKNNGTKVKESESNFNNFQNNNMNRGGGSQINNGGSSGGSNPAPRNTGGSTNKPR